MTRALTAKGTLSEWQDSVRMTMQHLGFAERSTRNESVILGKHEQYGMIRVRFFVPEVGKTRLEIAYQDEAAYNTFKKELTGVFRKGTTEKPDNAVQIENQPVEIPQQLEAEPRSQKLEEALEPSFEDIPSQEPLSIEDVESIPDHEETTDKAIEPEVVEIVWQNGSEFINGSESIEEDREDDQQDVSEPIENDHSEEPDTTVSEQVDDGLINENQSESSDLDTTDDIQNSVSEFGSSEDDPEEISEKDGAAEGSVDESVSVKVCKKCGAEMDKKEKLCPQCGEKQLNMNLIIGIVVGVLVVLFLGGYAYTRSQQEVTPAVSTSVSQTQEQPKPITDEELSVEKGVVTLDQYNQIQVGMKYEEVCGIFGREGILFQKVTSPDENNVDSEFAGYYWEGQSGQNSMVTIYFKNGLVEDKDQYGFGE